MGNNSVIVKLIKVVVIFLVQFSSMEALANEDYQSFERLDAKQVLADIDTINQHVDSAKYYALQTLEILRQEIKMFGIWKTVQINSEIVFPFFLFLGMYFFWLLGKKRK